MFLPHALVGAGLSLRVCSMWMEQAMLPKASSGQSPAVADCRHHGYEARDHWARLPPGWSWTEVAAVATDTQNRVYVFSRGEHRVLIFNRDGELLASWGEGLFARPHGIFIGTDDTVYCTDDRDHTVRKFTADGRLLWTLGTSGQPSDTGATSVASTSFPRTADCSSLGESRAMGPVNSGCPTALPSIGREPCTWPTAKTAACNFSRQTGSTCPNGRTWPGRARSSSMVLGTSTSLSWASTRECGPARPPPLRMLRAGG